MSEEKINKLDWRYDVWADVETIYPKRCKVEATVTSVNRNYAFLQTDDGTDCFLGKDKAFGRFKINNLTDRLKTGEVVECTVIGYSSEKERLVVSSNLD